MNYRHVAAWLAFCALVMFAQASIFPFTIVSHRAFNSKFIELEVDMVISKVDEASKVRTPLDIDIMCIIPLVIPHHSIYYHESAIIRPISTMLYPWR